MNSSEFTSDPITRGVKYNNTLHPQVWKNDKINLKVRERLLKIANYFIDNLNIPSFKVEDIVLTGSMANYNYTEFSDFDLHVVTDYKNLQCDDIAEELYKAKKTIWNNKHNIKIFGHEVELYIEDVSNPPISGSVYSILNNEWIRKPTLEKPEWDREAVKAKVLDLIKRIDKVIDPNENSENIHKVIEKISNMRKSGLQKNGEFSAENLAFKILRNQGVLDKLRQEYLRRFDKEASMNEGLRNTLAGLALSTGVGLSGAASANFEKIEVSRGDTVFSMAKAFDTNVEEIRRLNGLDKNFTIRPGQIIKVPKPKIFPEIEPLAKSKQNINAKQSSNRKIEQPKIGNTKTLTGKPYEALLTRTARSSGINDPIELAAFLAQTSVETGRFKYMKEIGNKNRIEKMYDPKFNKQGAKVLGNTKPGDGWKYKGRGFIQLTGRDNYTRASRDLGIDIVKNPDLVAKDPEIAAKTSVWYWKTHVRPQVKDFRDTAAVTKAVQGGSSALDRREREFQNFKQFKLSMR